MGDITNVFESINNLIEEQKKEADKKGLSEYYKEATDKFFEVVKDTEAHCGEYYVKKYNLPEVHFKDINYGDSYFIFSHGSNSIIQFRVEECPGWLFGIWWSDPRDDSENDDSEDDDNKKEKELPNYVHGQLFAQYEDNIDKFKPSRSEYCEDIDYYLEDKDFGYGITKAKEMIGYIHKYPALAFYKDYNSADYNYEYIDLQRAERAFAKYKRKKIEKDQKREEFKKEILDFYKKEIEEMGIKNITFLYKGDGWSPAYDILIPLEDNLEVFKEEDDYNFLYTDEESSKEYKAEVKRFLREQKKIEKKYKKYYFWASEVIDSWLVVRKKEKIKEILECKD